jgi:glycosyltransferase involved in cell wall biosynthesis
MSLLDVVAVLGVRNEEVYLGNALRHLKANGVKYAVIDNGSDDDTTTIIRRREFSSHLVARRNLPYLGQHDLKGMLREKMALIEALKTDWVIHMDADEVMHPARAGETLQEAISRLDQEGYDAIDFNEFVFLPLDQSYVKEWVGFQPITTYYFYSPGPLRLMRAWKPSAGFSTSRQHDSSCTTEDDPASLHLSRPGARFRKICDAAVQDG